MDRHEALRRLDKKTRNKLRALLSEKDENVINRLADLRSKLGKDQVNAIEVILNNPSMTRAVKIPKPFPKKPPFADTLQEHREMTLQQLLSSINADTIKHTVQLNRLAASFEELDTLYAAKKFNSCIDVIHKILKEDGWSHALLRRIILIRENLEEDAIDNRIESLVLQAGIKGIVVSSLIHSYDKDQSILMIKRSIMNIVDRGGVNRYTRTLSKLTVQPLASSHSELEEFLREVIKCSLIDAIILAKYNSHLFLISEYPAISEISGRLGKQKIFEPLVLTYDASNSEGEYSFFKQSSAWLEYEPVRQYRMLIDSYYDASREEVGELPAEIELSIQASVGGITLKDLIGNSQFTRHNYSTLARLESSGTVTRSAIFNYWLTTSGGQIGFQKEELLTLMGLTRDLSRTVPIKAVRTAAKLAKDELVKLILLLLLAKRSKNELDSFLLRKLLEDLAFKYHEGCLVKLVEAYQFTHPYVAEYIYDISTEDFLAKLNKLAPHRSDIPEIRASLHEWMARFTKDDHYLQRARAVRIDHQINRVRNEIDDHRIYVDPSRFSSWLEDEMMIELNNAIISTGTDKKGQSVTCDETVISLVMTQSYSAFCSNAVFGISSYIGRRIRHGTFHGHLYSSVINSLEKSEKFKSLFSNNQFMVKWSLWKDNYNRIVEEIISERLHVQSRSKPLGLLTPEVYGAGKQEVLAAAVTNISKNYAETTSTADICQTIIDYCWRLAEIDLVSVVRYLKAQQVPLKNEFFLDEELVPAAAHVSPVLADTFRRDLCLSIDRKLSTMFGWFKRPSIIAPTASVSLLFSATVEEVKDTIHDFDPQSADESKEEIDLVGGFYHLIYDSLAIVVSNAARHSDRSRPLKRKFEIVPGKPKYLTVEMSSFIKPSDSIIEVSNNIEARKRASFQDANLYDKKSGISKLLLLESSRQDFKLEQYEVMGNEVKVRLVYALEH